MNSRPSEQVLLDEMDHRADIIKMIEASGKKVAWRGGDWLEGYFRRAFVTIVMAGDYPRLRMRREWRKRVDELGLNYHGVWLKACIAKVYRWLVRHGEYAR